MLDDAGTNAAPTGVEAGAPASTLSASLRAQLSLVRRDRASVGATPSLAQYAAYLQRSYDVVRASVPLMQRALEKCGAAPGQQRLAAYYREHIVEEAGHDELILRDLEEIGVSRAMMADRPSDPWLASAVGAQYYWIEHESPLALLGYIAFLEGEPPTDRTIAAIRPILPGRVDALRSLRVHSEADPHHNAMLDTLIDSLELGVREKGLIVRSALHTAEILAMAAARAADS